MSCRIAVASVLPLVLSLALPALAQPEPPTAPEPPAEPPAEPTPEPTPPAEATPPAPPAAPAPAPAPQPDYAAQGYAQQPAPGWQAGPPPEPEPKTRSGFVGIGRVGFVVGGSGELSRDCSGSFCSNLGTTNNVDYDEDSELVLGLDLLGHVSPNVRLGGGLTYSVSSSVKDPDGSGQSFDLGSDLAVQFVVEGVFESSPTTAIALRAQGGPLILFPGGELSDMIDNEKQACSTAGISCSVDEGPFVGWTAGGGVGFIVDVGKVGLRADFLVAFYDVKIFGENAQGTSLTTHVTGNRFILGMGVEF